MIALLLAVCHPAHPTCNDTCLAALTSAQWAVSVDEKRRSMAKNEGANLSDGGYGRSYAMMENSTQHQCSVVHLGVGVGVEAWRSSTSMFDSNLLLL